MPATNIFVNLPVKDLPRSMDFFKALGFSFNPQFTDETAACMIIGPNMFAMLLTHPKFSEFTTKDIADAHKTCELLCAVSFESRAEVDAVMEAALAAGGAEPRAAQDLGFMYSRAFNDPDGHTWEPFWMDPAAVQ